MRMRFSSLVMLCAALPGSFPLLAQVSGGKSFHLVAFSKLVATETFTTVAPTILHLHHHDVLCYELYIVNRSDTPVDLSEVQVLETDSNTVLQDKTGHDLAAAVEHPSKQPTAAEHAITIESEEQIVFYAWVDLAPGSIPPASVRHALTMRRKMGKHHRIVTRPISVKQISLQIESPLRGSNWLAANGPSNTSGHRRTLVTLNEKRTIPQRYAIDWLKVDRRGRTFSGDELRNESYFCYGEKVHAVADGVVTELKDGIPQNIPGVNSRAVPITLETIGGNHVIVEIANGIYAFYAHLQPGSLPVKLGDYVKSGQVLGRVGNSGNATEPHLHFHLIDHNSPLSGEGLPFSFRSYYFVGREMRDSRSVKLIWRAEPQEVKLQTPAENDIVDFPAENSQSYDGQIHP